MKTIKVTDEMYEALMAISKEMNSQDHQSTRMPYLFHIAEEVLEPTCEGCGTPVWVHIDGDKLRTENEIIEYIAEYKFWEDDDFMPDAPDDVRILDSTAKATEMYESDEYETYLESEDFTLYNEEPRTRYSNGFFTEKACQEHIARNNYHYHNASACLIDAFRNPEMETVSKFLCEISGGEIHL